MKNDEKNGLPEIYKYYKNRYRFRNPESFIEYKRFVSVLKEFNQELSRLLIEEGIEFKMPVRLGSIRIRKYKSQLKFKEDGTIDKRNLAVDWKETRKLWGTLYPGKNNEELKKINDKPLVHYLNEHTDGYRFLFYWNKKGSNAKNRKIYSIIFTYSNFRYLAKVLKSNNKPEYYE